jgi:hypothetical protein
MNLIKTLVASLFCLCSYRLLSSVGSGSGDNDKVCC